jgi:hypothetical protein
MVVEDGNKSREQSMSLLAHGRQVGANATEAGSTVFGSERARNPLLDFGHAQISLGLIIGPSRQLHRLHLWRKEHSRSPIPFIPYMDSSSKSSTIGTIGENIASPFMKPLTMCARSQRLGQALSHQILQSYWLVVVPPLE